MRRPIDYILLFLKGVAMGAADVVPGVSGGTIAFISGIYEELLQSIKSINITSLRVLLREGPGAFWRSINGNFLLSLVAGILCSIFSLAQLVNYGMDQYPLLVWSFFFGLIIASIIWIARVLNHWYWPEWLGLLVGTTLAGTLFFVPPAIVSDGLLLVFGAGALAICAMILPGISGSFILVLIGMYPILIEAITVMNFPVLICFGLGCVFGLLSFSRILSWLLNHYHSITLSVLVGFLVGSLTIVWPWKNSLEVMFTASGKEIVLAQENLMPWQYGELYGVDPQTVPAIILMLLGIALVLGLEYIGGKRERV